MRGSLWAAVGLSLLVCSCGGGDDGGGSGGSGAGGTAAGGSAGGGATGGTGGAAGGSGGSGGATGGSGGTTASGGSGAGFGVGDCLPSEQAGDHCADATYQYEYMCIGSPTPPPAADCQAPSTPLPAGTGYCCSVALCQRQKGTEYLCTDPKKPNSYLCHSAAPAPAGCDSVGSIGYQYCCP